MSVAERRAGTARRQRPLTSQQILERVYRRDRGGSSASRGRVRRPWLTREAAGRAGRVAAVLSLLATFWVGVHIYYYNRLVALETTTKAEWAQVETQLQRRHNIQKNLARIMLRYSAHERGVLTDLTELRSRGTSPPTGPESALPESRPQETRLPEAQPPASLPGAGADPLGSGATAEGAPALDARTLDALSPEQLQKLLSRIMVVAEQYPQLKLSENSQQFSAAIVEVEAAIAERTVAYNLAVNAYRIELTQFPSNIFGRIAGFKPASFYRPQEQNAEYQPVEF